jgi:hypothetical protein
MFCYPLGAFGIVRLARRVRDIDCSSTDDESNPEEGKSNASSLNGNFNVYVGKEDEFVAIKILSKKMIMNAKQIDHVFNEMNLTAQLDHNFIVKNLLLRRMQYLSSMFGIGKFERSSARFQVALHHDGICGRRRTLQAHPKVQET